jgi:predicted O-methyltransferase YrrM
MHQISFALRYSALCLAEAGATVVTMERCPLQAQAARDFLRHGNTMGQVQATCHWLVQLFFFGFVEYIYIYYIL